MNKLPFLNRFCYFEINYILKNVIYSSLFNAILHISRLTDVNPELALKAKVVEAQKELTNGLLMIEMLVKQRQTEQAQQSELQAQGQASAETQLAPADPAPGDAVVPTPDG